MNIIYQLFIIYIIFIVCFTLLFSYMRKYIDKLGSYVSKINESITKKILKMYIIYILLGLPLTFIVYFLYNKMLLNAIVITVSILTCIRILANPTFYLNDKLDYNLANKYKGQYVGLLLGFTFASLLILYISKFDQINIIISNINIIEILKLFPSLNMYSILFYLLFLFMGALASEFILYLLDPIVQIEYPSNNNSSVNISKSGLIDSNIKSFYDVLNVFLLIASLITPLLNSVVYADLKIKTNGLLLPELSIFLSVAGILIIMILSNKYINNNEISKKKIIETFFGRHNILKFGIIYIICVSFMASNYQGFGIALLMISYMYIINVYISIISGEIKNGWF